jgi:hypothetical protein
MVAILVFALGCCCALAMSTAMLKLLFLALFRIRG